MTIKFIVEDGTRTDDTVKSKLWKPLEIKKSPTYTPKFIITSTGTKEITFCPHCGKRIH